MAPTAPPIISNGARRRLRFPITTKKHTSATLQSESQQSDRSWRGRAVTLQYCRNRPLVHEERRDLQLQFQFLRVRATTSSEHEDARRDPQMHTSCGSSLQTPNPATPLAATHPRRRWFDECR